MGVVMTYNPFGNHYPEFSESELARIEEDAKLRSEKLSKKFNPLYNQKLKDYKVLIEEQFPSEPSSAVDSFLVLLKDLGYQELTDDLRRTKAILTLGQNASNRDLSWAQIEYPVDIFDSNLAEYIARYSHQTDAAKFDEKIILTEKGVQMYKKLETLISRFDSGLSQIIGFFMDRKDLSQRCIFDISEAYENQI